MLLRQIDILLLLAYPSGALSRWPLAVNVWHCWTASWQTVILAVILREEFALVLESPTSRKTSLVDHQSGLDGISNSVCIYCITICDLFMFLG